MGRECSFTGTARSALDSMTNSENLDIDLNDNEVVAQGQDSYSREEQEEQGHSEPSPSSTIIRATNEGAMIQVDAASSTISAGGSRAHDLGPELNDEWPSTQQPELSMRSMAVTSNSSGTDEVVQGAPLASGRTERPQLGLMQALTSPSTNQSMDMSMDLDSWLDYVPFDDNILDLFPLTGGHFDGCGLTMDTDAYSQQLNGHVPAANFNPQQLISTMAQQYQLPDIARNLFPRLDHDASRWLGTKPSVSNFDRTIVNRFLNVFFTQVPSTFTSFECFRISSSTHEEGLLAAAAFGCLYCTTRGSFVIARALCSDARRLVLTRV
ncbi:fungal zn(2)-Cys(6) binuclear cluster domain-containing protein [Fusarium phyllophilum]|uniref:Fungal zn(2)-Cys(6) binuclear cluster domain-containing protein n=1 Tax=Fusarium phyllophilum TaxID=47803 RepID=A0A8H5K1G4_9HYPO|nr:fungal zn(2)-Cys(6) binuclear cluster domain-containing protein [Fusarium phyllophilum]